MTRYYRLAVLVACCAAGLAACQSRNSGLIAAQSPDEFLVLGRSPLVLPPDYGLRPPSPGEPRPQELSPETTARAALTGGRVTALAASEGERLLLTKAGAAEADPRIKEVIDDEQGDLAHKPQGFANLVMFWRKDQPQTQVAAADAPGANTATPLDPAAETRRLQGLTGGQPVLIQREAPAEPKKRGFKLPGL